MSDSVLLVEDNPKIAESLREQLEAEGFAVEVSRLGYEAEEKVAQGSYSAVVLDLMLPDCDGVQVCQNLRRRKVATPILMLTALDSTEDKVGGLEAGADDYLTKPFAFEELLARLRALLRRGAEAGPRVLTFGDLSLDVDRRSATRAGHKIKLSNKEFGLLYFLMQNPEKVVSRTSLVEKVWDMNYEPNSNVVDVYISSLRKKIDADFEAPLIHTVIGAGYRFGQAER